MTSFVSFQTVAKSVQILSLICVSTLTTNPILGQNSENLTSEIVNQLKEINSAIQKQKNNDSQILVTAITVGFSFLSGMIVLYVNDWRRKTHNLHVSIKSITSELETIHSDLKKYAKDSSLKKEKNSDGPSKFTVTSQNLQTSSFDSVIYSGMFKEFTIEIQERISDTYTRIKVCNELGRDLRKLVARDSLNPKFEDNLRNEADSLDNYLKETESEVDKLLTLLKAIPKKNASKS